MRKVLKVFGLILLMVLAWLGLVWSEWLPQPTAEQDAALALLEKEPAHATGERNAFAALWLFGYDVPEADIERIAASDAAAFNAAAQGGWVKEFKSTAEGKYPALPSPDSTDPLLCENWGGSCLARVRANPEASRAQLTKFAQRLEKGERLAQYDHFRYAFLMRYDSPIAGPGGLFPLQTTAVALDYLDGNVDAAFARVCRNTATWRRLRAHSDALIMDMLGVAQMSSAARLYAEMLAEQPADFVAPCPETFAPLADAEVNQCATIRHEFIGLKNTVLDDSVMAALTGESESYRRRAFYALVNSRHMIAASAPYFANQCGVENEERVQRRDPAALPVDDSPCGAMDWAFDPAGCHIMEIPAYNDYHIRVLDLDARLKLLQTVIWLRTQPADGDRAAQFATRPAPMQSAQHAMEFDSQRSVLRMTNLHKSKGEHWEIPFAAPIAASPATTTETAPASDDNAG